MLSLGGELFDNTTRAWGLGLGLPIIILVFVLTIVFYYRRKQKEHEDFIQGKEPYAIPEEEQEKANTVGCVIGAVLIIIVWAALYFALTD